MFEEEFNNLFYSLQNSNTGIKENALRNIVSIISDQKLIYFDYQKVMNEINKIEDLLQSKNTEIPVELTYRKASIFYDSHRYEKAMLLYENILNECKTDLFKDKSKYYLIRILLKMDSPNIENINSLDLEKAKVYFKELQESARKKALDSSVLGELFQVNSFFESLNNKKNIILESYPGGNL